MKTPDPSPRAVRRRLQLSLTGWRCQDGCWSRGTDEMLSEELVDALTEAAFRAALGGVSAVSHN